MSDPAAKPPGKGRGRFQVAGVQAQQSSDIDGLKAAFAEAAAAGADLEARVEALEAAGTAEPPPA